MDFKYYTSKPGRPFNDLPLCEKTVQFEKYFVVNVVTFNRTKQYSLENFIVCRSLLWYFKPITVL